MNRTRRSLAIVKTGLFAAISVIAACDKGMGEYDTSPPLISAEPPSNGSNLCAPTPASQTTVSDTVYYRYTSGKTWLAAKSDCEAMGGRLAVPISSSVNDSLKTLASGSAAQIGIYQNSSQATPDAGFVTVNGVTPSYFNWGSGEPNDYPSAAEDNQENCVSLRTDGAWNDRACGTGTAQYICEFGSAPVACPSGASCAIASGATTYSCQCPAGQTYDPTNNGCFGGALAIQVARLEVDKAVTKAAFVNFPLHAKVGLKGTGNTNSIQVTLGLMEKPASGASATDAELAALRSCTVGGTKVKLTGDGTLTWAEFDGILPPECLGTDSQRNYNFFVLVDGVEEVSTEENKYLVFNAKEATTPLGMGCQTTDPMTGTLRTGCVIDVTVKPPPGLDVALVSAKPTSSVAVLNPSTAAPNLKPTGSEAPRPLVTVNSVVTVFGRDRRTAGASTLPSAINFDYDIIAVPDTNAIGRKPLSVNPEGRTGSISTLKPGEKLEVEARLHPTTDFRTLTSPGGAWAGVTSYKIRGCARVAFLENGDPQYAGAFGTGNNCQEFTINMVAGNHDSSSASSQSESNTYSGSWGSSSSLQMVLAGTFTNTFDTTGAYSSNDVKGTINSFFGDFTLFDGWGNGQAVISTAKADLDYGLKIFGVSLLSDGTSASASVSYTKDLSYSKSSCITYSYGFVIVSVELEGCFKAEAGVDLVLSASAGTTSKVSANVRPYLTSSLSVTASLNVTLYKVSLSGSITLLGVNSTEGDGVTATLNFTVNSTSPVKITISFDITAFLRISTLDGSVDLVIEELETKWCTKKIWGVKIKYFCGFSYDTAASYTLFSFDGYSTTQSLLARTGSSITIQ